MSKNRVELSRRNLLAGLGSFGIASAGAGVGTTALLNDTEELEDSTLTAGLLDLKVGWQQTYTGPIPGSGGTVGSHAVNAFPDTTGNGVQDQDSNGDLLACEGPAPTTPNAFQSSNYPDQQHLVELSDVKPGDEGEVTFSLRLCDNPGWVWLVASNFTDGGGTTTDQEPTPDEGELAENIMVRIWYDEDCDNEYDSSDQLIFGPGASGSGLTGYTGSNPATLAKAMEVIIDNNGGRVPLDGQSPFMGYGAGATAGERDLLPVETRLCIGLKWWIPIEVGNVIQGDIVEFDLGFYAEQSQNNDGTLGP